MMENGNQPPKVCFHGGKQSQAQLMYGSWGTETLKVGAVSVRSFGWYYANHPKYPTVGAVVDNSINCQVFKPGTAQSSTNSAFSNTLGIARMYNADGSGTELQCYYKAVLGSEKAFEDHLRGSSFPPRGLVLPAICRITECN